MPLILVLSLLTLFNLTVGSTRRGAAAEESPADRCCYPLAHLDPHPCSTHSGKDFAS